MRRKRGRSWVEEGGKDRIGQSRKEGRDVKRVKGKVMGQV
jgi:hypothetical protein